jgi:hypothetical protein
MKQPKSLANNYTKIIFLPVADLGKVAHNQLTGI